MQNNIQITAEQYFGVYAGHADITPEIVENSGLLLAAVNEVYALAYADGCELPVNPTTGSGISGRRHGGFRPRDSLVGADNSLHKDALAVDRYDPLRQLASWCLGHPHELMSRGLYMEDPRWTPTWVHLQLRPPRSGRLVYIPSSGPALAAAPAPWRFA